MTDLLETLYVFAMEHRVDRYLNEDPGYRENIKYSEERLVWLNSRLNEEERTVLDDYATMQNLAQAAVQECLFRAALVLGFELHHA